MIIKIVFGFLMCLFLVPIALSQTELQPVEKIDIHTLEHHTPETLEAPVEKEPTLKYRESKRFVAALLCLTLGPFGMHRLYLGTRPQVAAAYSITLGGIGIVPVVDLFLITFSKDISRFKNNDQVIMWGK